MIAGTRAGNPAGNVRATARAASLPPDLPEARTLSWTPERSSGVLNQVYVDGDRHAVVDETELENAPQGAREHIEIFEVSPQNRDEDLGHVAATPSDEVLLSWSEVSDADRYELERSQTIGTYDDAPIARREAGESSYEVQDGPLEDGTYYYRLTAYDAAGNSVESSEISVTIDSAPEAPLELAVSVSSGTLELTWTAPDGGGVDHYAVYRGEGSVTVSGSPHATPSASPWSEDVSALTGRYLYLVRAVDASGNEDAGLEQMVAVDLDAGSEVSRPNSPQIVRSGPAAGGEAEVDARYMRAGEDGEASELRVYANDGAGGAVDYSSAVATESLGTAAGEVVRLISSGLSGGNTYKLAVRAASGGTEDQNTETVEVTTDATAPGTPSLSAEVV